VYLPAGNLHAYLGGTGVEIMASSDNVLRGGLTPKHIDSRELVRLVDPSAAMPPVLHPSLRDGLARFEGDVPDFALSHATVHAGADVAVRVDGPAIVLATAGSVLVVGDATDESAELAPGEAVFVTPDEGGLQLRGVGEAFIAQPGSEA
jgi:mannose-6-phosphate isomerase